MRCARALPTNQLMPAASSRNSPAATLYWVDLLQRLSGRTLLAAPHAGHPIDHHVAGHRPWTQIRLGAGTRNVGQLQFMGGCR
jgi:hypothetical protein